jgi:hypothetical protein
MLFGKKSRYFSCLLFALTLMPSPLFALEVGEEVTALMVKDADDKPAPIPFIGEKMVGIIYSDKDGADLNNPIADALQAKKYDYNKYQGIGVANLKDTFAPNWIIRMIIRNKIEKYKTVIVADEDHTLPTKWNLGNCKGTSVFILVGKDRKVKYFYKGQVPEKDYAKIFALIETEINQTDKVAH